MAQRAAKVAQRGAIFDAAVATPTPFAEPQQLPNHELFHLGGRAFHSSSLPSTQQGCAAVHKTSAGERHAKKATLLQRSHHPIRVPSTPALTLGESLFFVSKVPFFANFFRSNFFWKAPFFAIFRQQQSAIFRHFSREKSAIFRHFSPQRRRLQLKQE
jgi:hypothetical protein